MSTETKAIARPLPVGGEVTAIIPQNLDEIFRVSDGIIAAGFAPYALTANKTPAEKRAAVAITIMSGAELGLPPMASLRSFTVINGKPALYGDGLINVIRMRKAAKVIKTGFVPGKDAEFGDDAYGYCEAERADTGETSRFEFTVGDARRAGLWDERVQVPSRKRDDNGKLVPNEAPWFRYPKRMLGWRAAGYCLRELFGDVLGGMTDEYEARESTIPEAAFTEIEQPAARGMPPSPPKEEAIDVLTDEQKQEFIDKIEATLAPLTTVDDVEKAFDELNVQVALAGDDEAIAEAFDIKGHHVTRTTPVEDDEAAA